MAARALLLKLQAGGLIELPPPQTRTGRPCARAPPLASHLLARATRRLSADWQARYGHPLWLVETFVEQDRFAGTAYQAAGWLPLGQTTGRARQDRQRTLQSPLKLAFGILCGVGRPTVTRAISFHGNTQKDWSADYKVFSRSPWEPRALSGGVGIVNGAYQSASTRGRCPLRAARNAWSFMAKPRLTG